MPKNTEDPIARTVVENQIGDMLAKPIHDAIEQPMSTRKPVEYGREVLANFPSVSFETKTAKVAGQEVPLRRPVIVGKWEVDPNGSAAQ